ncbi:MAG TPA: family 43 glycosylhydrolase, partial [Gemmataceae bacterium]
MFARPLLILLLLLAGPHAGRAGAPGAEVRDFFNVLLPDGADPWVIRHTDGYYYMTVTTGTDIVLRRSATLSGIGGGERKVIWTPPATGPKSKNLWAPEIHFLRGKWYVYYAADDGDNADHRMYVLENDSDDPFEGAFVDKGKIHDPAADRWAIDGTVLEAGGKLYFLWSGWEGCEDIRQDLYIAPMQNPWTLAGPRVEISRPTFAWEMRGAPPTVNEGPQVLVRGGRVHVVYSASGSWTDHYCLGLLTARADSDLLDPASWRKHPVPVFEGGNGVVAPGHCSFVRSPDGREDWLVYHAARHAGSGWARHVRAQPFSWHADGTPRFGAPAPPDVPLPLPGGEPPRRRYEAEGATLGGGARAARRNGASGGAAVVSLRARGSFVEFDVTAAEAGSYNLSVRFANRTRRKAPASHQLSVNGEPAGRVRYPYFGPGNWSCAVLRVELAAGRNKLRFTKGGRVAAIDCIDVFPVRLAGR